MVKNQGSVFKLCCLVIILVVVISVDLECYEVRVGLLVHDVALLWGKDRVEGGVDLNAEILLGVGLARPMVGFSINSDGQTSCAYCGISIVPNISSVLVCVSVGSAVQVNSVRALGSTLLFRLSLEVGYKRFSILFSHLSNGAGIFGWNIPNAGVDTLGVRYRF